MAERLRALARRVGRLSRGLSVCRAALRFVAEEFRARLGYAAEQVVEALSILVDAHDAGTFAESSQLQQYWRDANMAARHAGLQATVGYEVYGKSILGVPERISFTV